MPKHSSKKYYNKGKSCKRELGYPAVILNTAVSNCGQRCVPYRIGRVVHLDNDCGFNYGALGPVGGLW